MHVEVSVPMSRFLSSLRLPAVTPREMLLPTFRKLAAHGNRPRGQMHPVFGGDDHESTATPARALPRKNTAESNDI